MLELGADRKLAADEVSVSEEGVEVQSGVGEDASGVVDQGDSSLKAGGQG